MRKKTINACLFIVLLLSVVPVFAQGWEKTYPEGVQTDISEAQKSLLLPNGDLLVLVNFYDYTDAYRGDFFLLRLSPNGNKLWKRTFDFGGFEVANDLIATADGGYLVLFQTTIFNPSGPSTISAPKLLKLDAQFNQTFLQSTEFNFPDWTKAAKHVFENTTGYLVTGVCRKDLAPLASNGFSAQYDFQGNLQDSNLFSSDETTGYDNVLPNADGTFMIFGASYLPDSPHEHSCWKLAKMNATGTQQLWQKTYTDSMGVYSGSVLLKAPDGGYLLVGSRNSAAYLLKTDDDGNQLWDKSHFIPENLGWFLAGTTLANGSGYAFVSFDLFSAYDPRFILATADLQGQILSTHVYGLKHTNNVANHMLALPDQGFLISGARDGAMFNGFRSPYLVRTDASGNTFYSTISGTLTSDTNGDCITDADTLSQDILVLAYKDGFNIASASADSMGRWSMKVDSGNIQIIPQYISGAMDYCPDTLTAALTFGDSLGGFDFTAYYHPQPVDSVFGYIFEDVDGDCLRDPFETTYPGWTIKLTAWNSQGQPIPAVTTTTDQNGRYVFYAPPGITNETEAVVGVGIDPVDGLNCRTTCQPNQVIHFAPGSTIFQADFGVTCDSFPPCTGMEVDIATARIRACEKSIYTVNYCNNGGVVAENAYITVAFDSLLTINAASLPYTLLPDNTLRFDVGTVGVEFCGSFSIEATLACDPALTGLTFCAVAHAYPDSSCAPQGPNFDGSQIQVRGFCEEDSVVFVIQNIGLAPMQQSLDYIVIEDNVMLLQGSVQLPAGAEYSLSYAALGHFYRLATSPSPNINTPVAWVEGCGSNAENPVSLGFVNQYPLGDETPWLDVFCLPAVNSYDPNDKTGFPMGVKAERYIEQNTELEYFIRFQNTGTAEAINIEIRDTLQTSFLDIASVRPGPSSHPYSFDLQGNNVVVFKFLDINLPDSSANEAASHGFVKFRVQQQKDVPIGTKINNQAAIFFDINAPVITNRTLHTIGHDFLVLKSFSSETPGIELKIQPNPAHTSTTLILNGLKNTGAMLRLRVFSSLGVPVIETDFTGNTLDLNVAPLMEGIWFFEVLEGGKRIGYGKFVRQ